MRLRSLRARLTVWSVGAMAVVLAAYAAAVYLLLARNLHEARDHHLEEDLEVAAEMVVVEAGDVRWRVESDVDPGYDAGQRRWVEVWTPDGRRLFSRVSSAEQATQQSLSPPGAGANGFSSASLADRRELRVLVRTKETGRGPLVFRVARVDRTFDESLGPALIMLLLGIPVAAVAAGAGGYVLARRALGPVGVMGERARSISADRLHERLPVENAEDELGQLATVFNETFARLGRSFDAMRQFTADASHELRTPLTALRSVGEVGLRQAREPEAYREIIGSMLEEVDRLSRLVDNLLLISRADARQVTLSPERLDLGDLARDVVAQLAVLAEEKQQAVAVDSRGPVPVVADRLVLRQAVINLVDNAVKFGPVGGSIRLSLAERSGEAVLDVCDNGPGIPAEHQTRVFDRFYRVDKGRSREAGGAGLGLSIARWAVEANRGRIELHSPPDGGCRFRVVLPSAGTRPGPSAPIPAD